MNSQEVCNFLNISESTLKTNFPRIKRNFEKKNIFIEKEGYGNQANYTVTGNLNNLSIGKAKNISNQKFGKLTVLYRNIKKEKEIGLKEALWHCKCECGNEKDLVTSVLTSGKAKSCGCLLKEWNKETKLVDLTGQKIGHWTVLYQAESKNQPSGHKATMWHCQCDCANKTEKDLAASYLKNAPLNASCGCEKQSKGEYSIKILLKENNIPFETEKQFNNCFFQDTQRQARFDFYVNDQYIIEFDGQQHFSYDNNGWNTKENFYKTKQHDKIKNQYCFEHNIPIIRIPYTHLKDICIEDLIPETSQFLLKKRND